MLTNRQTDKKRTNRQNYTNFERNLAVMVICVPVKFEFDWTNCFRVRVRKRKCGRTNGQTNRQNYTNFERILAMMVIYLPVKFEFNWTNCFELESGNKNVDRQTDGQTNGPKKRTNEQTELHQFRKKPSYDGDLCPCQV